MLGGMVTAIGSAHGIGFPLPFTPCFMAPGCSLLLVIASTVLWGKRVRGNPAVQAEIISYLKVVGAPVSLIFIYPAYNYVFLGLSLAKQTAFALLLPAMKILTKNAIAYLVRHIEDFKPKVVIFNVEILHALFVASCMQQSNALHTTIVLMTMDFLQACASLRDVDLLLKSLRELTNSATQSSAAETRASQAHSKYFNPLDAVMYLLSINRQLQSDGSLRLNSQAKSQPPRPNTNVIWPNEIRKLSSTVPAGSSTRVATKQRLEARRHFGRSQKNAVHSGASMWPRSPSMEALLDAFAGAAHLDDADKQRLTLLGPQDRLQVIQQTLQLLHLTEFLLLVEFTEVVVPCIYCVFMGAVSQMPNRQFYSNLHDLDDVSLKLNIAKVLAYAGLEIVSFIILAALLRRKTRVSPLKQLAFVLESQWQLVQSKLVLWVLFSLPTTLAHMGIDYSFQFAWLHKDK